MQKIITHEDLPNLKREYTKAIKAKKKEFKLQLRNGGKATLLTTYAKYVIEFLSNQKQLWD